MKHPVYLTFPKCLIGIVPWLAFGCGSAPRAAEQTDASEHAQVLSTTTVDDWTWVEIDGARCREGGQTGVGFRRHPGAKKTLIFLDGGGACYSSTTCALNPYQYGLAEFQEEVHGTSTQEGQLTQGIFDQSVPLLNPMDDWNQVFIPYCTGDMHAGSAPATPMPWIGPQDFVGYDNMQRFLSFVVDEFSSELTHGDAEVVFAGESAGGWGVALNAPRLAALLPGVPLTVVSDSSPFFSNQYMVSCLQNHLRSLWNLDATVLHSCGSSCSGGNWAADWHTHLMQQPEHVRFAFISSHFDSVANLILGTDIASNAYYSGCNLDYLSEPQFEAGLLQLQARMAARAGTATFLIDGTTEHQWLAWDRFYSEWQDWVPLVNWFDDVVDRTRYRHIGL